MKVLGSVFNARKNLIVEGNMLSGKTTNIMFPIVENIISKKEGFLVIDSRCEYINQYYNKLKENDYDIVVVNLKSVSRSNGWNPLTYPYKLFKKGEVDRSQEYVQKIADMLCESEEEKELFMSLVFAHYEDAASTKINFNSIKYCCDFYNKNNGINDVLTDYLCTKDYNKRSNNFASHFLYSSKEDKSRIVSNIRCLLNYYTSKDDISILLNETNIDFDKIGTKPTAVFLIGIDEDIKLNRVLSMFIEQFYMILLDININKFNFVLDNIDTIDKFNDLRNILSSCTYRNIKTYLVTRSIDELKKKYGEYILRLCDILTISESKVELRTNDDLISEIKNFKNISIRKSNIEYPSLDDKTAYMFDPLKYIKDYRRSKILNNTDKIVNNFDKKINNIDLDNLIKKIDNKIEELQEQEKKDKEKDNKLFDVDKYIKKIDEKIEELEKEELNQKENNEIDKQDK